MTLCTACGRITVAALLTPLDHVPAWWERLTSKAKPRGMIHHEDARQLSISSAAGCSLCAMMIEAILQYNSEIASTASTHKGPLQDFEKYLLNSPIYLRPNFDPLKRAFPEYEQVKGPCIRGFKIFVPVQGNIVIGQLRLFASKDSPARASSDFVGRPPLPASDSPEAFDLVDRWMSRCLGEHKVCRETFSGAILDETQGPILPTRVIRIGASNEIPRLVQTGGKRAHYTALSHCWGRKKPPLMATKFSIKRFMTGLPWSEIPTAYREAMIVTRRLGFEFLWIDSLCILQDDPDDWLNESKSMGAVYQNAILTIAASHASDCSQPCFFPRPPPPPSVELPYVNQDGECKGSIFATHMPIDYTAITPESSPLDSRAWATQEWLLSRRIIFYTAGAVVWSCKEISQRETGGSFHSNARNPRWKAIVEKYSARLLTYWRDRLVALEGLHTELAKKRPNDTYCVGLWKHDMPDQLLWYCREPAEREKNPLDLPTWTWASTIHGVRFLQMKHPKNVCRRLKFDEHNNVLALQGVPRKVLLTSYERPDVRLWVATLPAPPLMAGVLEHELHAKLQCAISVDNAVIGRAILDEEDLPERFDTYSLQLMTEKVNAAGTKYYKQLVLLLLKVPQLVEVFERIGAGFIISNEPIYAKHAPTTVYIR